MIKVPGQSDLCSASEKPHTTLHVLISSARVYKDVDVGYMLTTKTEKKLFFPFNSENGIWIYQPDEKLLVKPDKFPNCERVIVCQCSGCSSSFV